MSGKYVVDSFSDHCIAEHIRVLIPHIIHDGAEYYIGGKDNVWKRQHTLLFERMIELEYMAKLKMKVPTKEGDDKVIYLSDKMSNSKIKGVFGCLKRQAAVMDFFADVPAGCAFLDKFLKPNGEQVPLTLEHKVRFSLPFEYDPTLESPVFDSFTDLALEEDTLLAVMRWFGGALVRDLSRHASALIMVGHGSNGKGTIGRFMYDCFPDVERTTLEPNDIKDFQTRYLAGSSFNYAADIDEAALNNCGNLKSAISGDPMSGTVKYGTHMMEFTPRGAHLIGCNAIPHTPDTSSGFFRRWIIIPFNHEFKGSVVDIDFAEKLAAERQAVASKAVAEYLKVGNRRLVDLEPQCSTDLKHKWRYGSDPVTRWLTDKAVEATDTHDKKIGHVYESFRRYVLSKGGHPCGEPKFIERIKIATGATSKKNSAGGKRWNLRYGDPEVMSHSTFDIDVT